MKSIIPSCLLLNILLLCSYASSQDTALIRKLEGDLPDSKGSKRTEILNDLAWEIKFSDLNKAIKLAVEAKSLAESLRDTKGIMLANKNLAACYFLNTDLIKAEEFIDKAIELSAVSKDLYQNGKIFNLKAVISRDLHKTGVALKFQNKALEAFRELHDSTEISGNLHNLAYLYKSIHEDEKALSLYNEVFEIESRLGNSFGIARTANNLAGELIEMGSTEKAISYYELAEKKFESIGNLMGKAAALHGQGLAFEDLGEYQKAIEHFQEALDINLENGYNNYIASNYFQLGQTYSYIEDYNHALIYYNLAKEAYFKNNDLTNYGISLLQIGKVYQLQENDKLCLEYAENALNMAKLNNSLEVWAGSNYLIYQIKRKQGKLDEAVEYLENYVSLQDSIKKYDKQNLKLELQAKYDFEKIEKENIQLIAESKLSKQNRYLERMGLVSIIIIALLLTGLIIMVLISSKKIKLKNKQLEESNATKDKFFSIVAHDLKNPFSSLLGFSDLLVKNMEIHDRAKLKVYAETLNKAIHQTYQLVENLLGWSRSQRNAIEIHKEDLELKDLVDQQIAIFINSAKDKKITVSNKVPRDIIIYSDKNILNSILRNLISNAIKFTGDNGFVEMTGQLRDQGVIVAVTDTGQGFDAQYKEMLFKMQNGYTSKGTHDEPGTGLGLMLCRDFIERLDGKIWAESEPGKGSTFSFFLPEKE